MYLAMASTLNIFPFSFFLKILVPLFPSYIHGIADFLRKPSSIQYRSQSQLSTQSLLMVQISPPIVGLMKPTFMGNHYLHVHGIAMLHVYE